MSSNSIHDKIIALKNIVPERGATEAEAMNAIRLAAALMEKHGITEQDLRKAEFNRDMKKGVVDENNKHLDPAAQLCGVVIAEFCEVKVWSSKDGNAENLNFYGLNQDVEMAEFLYAVIREAMSNGWANYLKVGNYPRDVSRHKLYWSYRYGFRDRVNTKMMEVIKARKVQAQPTGTSLVVLKMQIVEQAFNESIALNFRKRRAHSFGADSRSYLDGAADGDKVNINRPLNSSESSGRFLS